jgi:hypothetical protein
MFCKECAHSASRSKRIKMRAVAKQNAMRMKVLLVKHLVRILPVTILARTMQSKAHYVVCKMIHARCQVCNVHDGCPQYRIDGGPACFYRKYNGTNETMMQHTLYMTESAFHEMLMQVGVPVYLSNAPLYTPHAISNPWSACVWGCQSICPMRFVHHHMQFPIRGPHAWSEHPHNAGVDR